MTLKRSDFKYAQGSQIVYVPNHLLDYYKRGLVPEDHDELQYGFVLETHPTQAAKYWCRFWQSMYDLSLRTKANSEMVNEDNLFAAETRNQEYVNQTIDEIYTINSTGEVHR